MTFLAPGDPGREGVPKVDTGRREKEEEGNQKLKQGSGSARLDLGDLAEKTHNLTWVPLALYNTQTISRASFFFAWQPSSSCSICSPVPGATTTTLTEAGFPIPGHHESRGGPREEVATTGMSGELPDKHDRSGQPNPQGANWEWEDREQGKQCLVFWNSCWVVEREAA